MGTDSNNKSTVYKHPNTDIRTDMTLEGAKMEIVEDPSVPIGEFRILSKPGEKEMPLIETSDALRASKRALEIAAKSIALDQAVTRRKGAEGKVAFARKELDLALAHETIAHHAYLESLNSSTESDSPSD